MPHNITPTTETSATVIIESDPLAEVSETVVVETAPVTPEVAAITLTSVDPVIKKYDAFTEVDNTNKLDITQRLPNIFATDDDIDACFKLCQQMMLDSKDDNDKRKLLKEILDAFYKISINTYGDNYKAFFERNVGSLVQYVVGAKGSAVRIGYPTFNLDDNGETLSGKTALRYLNKITKTGNVTKIPLWHSGLVVTVDPFSEQEMLDLNMVLERQQIQLGMETRGASFTGDDIHVVCNIVDFI